MPKKLEKTLDQPRWITFLPFLIALLIMLPRLFSAQFGLLDDAVMLGRAEQMRQGDFSMAYDLSAGRFRLVYWLNYLGMNLIVGESALGFYLGHLLLLGVILLEMHLLLKGQGYSPWSILVTSLLFLFSMPIIENFYTLSKGEPLQLALILASLLALESLKKSRSPGVTWLLSAAITLSALAALLVKETTLLLAVIAGVWLLLRLLQRESPAVLTRRAHGIYLVAVSAAVALFFLLRSAWGAPGIFQGTYTNRYDLTLSVIIQKTLRWLTLLAVDFHYLVPLSLAVLLAFFWPTPWKKPRLFQTLGWALWCLLWLGALLPWEFAETYYLLPFSLGVAMLTGQMLPRFKQTLSGGWRWGQWGMPTLLALSMLLFTLTLPNYRTDAAMQLTLDRINQHAVSFAAEAAPENAEVLVNIHIRNEYVHEFALYLFNHLQRKDIMYRNIEPYMLEEISSKNNVFIMAPYLINQPALTVRIGVQQETQALWNRQLMESASEDLDLIETIEGGFTLSNINLPVIFCPLIKRGNFCTTPDPLVDTRWFQYGWEVYLIK